MNMPLKTLVVTTAALMSTSAHASLMDGIVDQWTVGVVGVFDTTTVVFDPNATGTIVTPTSLSWGTAQPGGGQSGLDITNLAPAVVNTNGAAVANTSVTHRNQPITGNSLDSVDLISTLTLTPFSPSAPGLPPASITFNINFAETPNSANPCADGGPNGSGVNLNGCADIFVIDKNALNFPFFYDLDGAGPLQNQQYYISFFELTSGLNPLPDEACTSAGATTPCLGFRTPEETDTTFQFASVITTRPVNVPEPGILATLGIGLLALGFSRRRKQQ